MDIKKCLCCLKFVILALVFGWLMGCQNSEMIETTAVSTAIADSSIIPEVGTGQVPDSITPTITLAPVTPDSTSTPTPTPTLAPTPFLCPNLQGRTIQHYLISDAMREEVRYLVHLPPCYDYYQDKAFPVLYLLHGWPMDEGHWDSLGMDELADDWISRGIVGPFIIVMPGVSSDGLYVHSSGGDGSFEGMFVNELLPAVDQAYRTWQVPEGRAIGGISRGGVWALEIALRHAELFGTVGAHSPALALNRPLPQYDPFVLAQEGPPDLRFYLNAGDADWARASTIRLRDVLLEKEADVIYQVHEGSHVDLLWRRALPDSLSFYTALWPQAFDDLPVWQGDQSSAPASGLLTE